MAVAYAIAIWAMTTQAITMYFMYAITTWAVTSCAMTQFAINICRAFSGAGMVCEWQG